MKRVFLLFVVFTLLGGAALGLGYFQIVVKPEMIKGFIAKAGPPINSVAAIEARTENWRRSLSAIGSLRATKGVEIAPQIPGVVKSIQFESSQEIAKGAPLIGLDDATEQADLKANMAALRNAEAAFKRQSTLVDHGSSAQANLDATLAQRDQALAALERTRAVIAQKNILAPFAGRLGIRKVDIGQYVSPGTPIVSLQQLDPIFVDFQAPEQNFTALAVGQTIDLTVDAFPGKIFQGKIAILDARVNTETRNFMVRAEAPNPEGKLAPGMFANVSVAIGEPQTLVILPQTALVYSLYGDSVFVVIPDPKAQNAQTASDGPGEAAKIVERRFVKVGETKGDDIAILEGVKPGEIIVSAGQNKLQPGMRVKVDPKANLAVRQPLPKL